jgi:hypothetical protein
MEPVVIYRHTAARGGPYEFAARHDLRQVRLMFPYVSIHYSHMHIYHDKNRRSD